MDVPVASEILVELVADDDPGSGRWPGRPCRRI
jgi:hypothetical protein